MKQIRIARWCDVLTSDQVERARSYNYEFVVMTEVSNSHSFNICSTLTKALICAVDYLNTFEENVIIATESGRLGDW